jgi:transcriptional regulator with XRE-family HTH domain
MKLSENIRRLRRERDITQEEFAEFFGLSPQAVSKWERGDGYPDVTLLPALARYFGTTLDALVGMEDEERRAKLTEINGAVNKIGETGTRAAITYLKKALREFPDEYAYWRSLAQFMGGMVVIGDMPDENEMREAAAIYERILKHCVDDTLIYNARTELAWLYSKLGEADRAEELVKALPSPEDRAKQLSYITRGEKQITAIQSLLSEFAHDFWRYTRFASIPDTYVFDTGGEDFGYTYAQRVKILEKGCEILDLLTDGDDAPRYPYCSSVNYRGMAALCIADGRPDDAMNYLEKAAEYALLDASLYKLFESAPDKKHSSVLLDRLSVFTQQNSAADLLTYLTRDDDLRHGEYDSLRDSPRFIAVTDKLREAVSQYLSPI